jgi:SAM-dependent methyltransferase
LTAPDAVGAANTAVQPPMLNIGCGGHYHPAWTNIDLAASGPDVIVCDILGRLPFPDGMFRAAYSCHVLEHLTPEDALGLLREARRVLAPGGIVRCVVPDGAAQARSYLDSLDAALAGTPGAEAAYDWSVVELIDQMVRTRPGGAMLDYLVQPRLDAEAFVRDRIGAHDLMTYRRMARDMTRDQSAAPQRPAGTLQLYRLLAAGRRRNPFAKAGLLVLAYLLRHLRDRDFADAFEEVLFRRSGEIHRWIYDRFSLARALARAGFSDIAVLDHATSGIPDFARYGLDEVGGAERRPYSLYIEAAAR